MVALVRARHVQVNASLWLDALIGGSVVAAVAAVFVLPPDLRARAVGEGWATAARLAYPLADLLLTGFAVVLWGAGRWRLDAWLGLALGFALIAVSDSVYVARADGGRLDPGLARRPRLRRRVDALAVAAWRSQPQRRGVPNARVVLPIAFTVASFALVCYEAFAELDVLAVALIRLTLLAVVLRLGLTLWWLSRQRADLEALAASDPLTGLGNYRAFQEQLGAPRSPADAEAGVIVLDLDHFKVLNDTFGHAEGDRVLQATATALSRTVGEPGFVARVGGEEFAILVPGADAQAAAAVAERCRAALSRAPGPRRRRSPARRAWPPSRRTRRRSPQLLQAADGALYWAKRSGRNRIRVYDPRHVVALSLHEQRREVEALLATRGADRPGLPADDGGRHRPRRRLRGARRASPPPCERPPHLWFAQAHRCGLGAVLEARAMRAALAVADRPAGTFLALNVSPAGAALARGRRRAAARPRRHRDRAHRARGLRRGRRARARADRAACPRRADRARRRRRGLRRASSS